MDRPPSATPLVAPPDRPRDTVLDLLRTVALIRVLLWHAFAAPWMTWFAAMPVMFFVAGTLLHYPGGKGSHRKLVRRRAGRLLIPLWVYGTVVAIAGILRGPGWPSPSPGLPTFEHALTWLLPLVDPVGADWHGGWLSTHLWYLRAYLWMLLLAPLLALLARRPARSLPVLALVIAAVEAAGWAGVPVLGAGTGRLLVGDAVTYGSFVVLGMAYHHRRTGWHPRALAAGAAITAAAAVGYAAIAGLPAGGVNESYTAVTLTGLAWLLAAGAAEARLRACAERRRIRQLTAHITRRAVTIYLWHPAAIALAYALLKGSDRFPRMDVVHHWPVPPVLVLALTAFSTALAVAAVGWVEDAAARRARRPRRRWLTPARRVNTRVVRLAAVVPPAAGALAMLVPTIMVPVAGDPAAASSVFGAPHPPSFRAALANDAFRTRRNPIPSLAPLGPVDKAASQLVSTVERWLAAQPDLHGLSLAVAVKGHVWAGVANGPDAASPLGPDDEFGAMSMTKTFTTTLVLHQVEAGRLVLDRPPPPVPGVNLHGDATRITVRQLLEHTSGLIDYAAAPGYEASRPLSPLEAVRVAVAAGLQSAPGDEVHYSNTNFQYLGLVLEQVSGRPYPDLLAALTTAQDLRRTRLGPGGPGWPGFSSGGVISTVSDLARWGDALFTPGRVLSPNSVRQITTLDDKNMALSMWPFCPCGTGPDGVKQYTAIGQNVGYGGLFRFHSGLTLAVRFDGNPGPLDAAIVSLAQEIEQTLRSSPATSHRSSSP